MYRAVIAVTYRDIRLLRVYFLWEFWALRYTYGFERVYDFWSLIVYVRCSQRVTTITKPQENQVLDGRCSGQYMALG